MDKASKNTEALPSLSAQILEYYQKYGKNRDLRKYLRLRESNSDLSVSELKSESTEAKFEDKILNTAGGDDNSGFCQEKPCSEDNIAAKRTMTNECLQSCPNQNLLESEFPKTNLSSHESNIGAPSACTTKAIETKTDACIQTDLKVFNGLVNSTKSNKPLEWDSLGDVGYEKQSPQNTVGNQLNALERNVLQNFFSQRGITISFADSKHDKGELNGQNKQEKWRETLENVRRKYNKVESSKSSIMSEYVCSGLSAYTEVHSTPKCEIDVDSKRFEGDLPKETPKTKTNIELSSNCGKYDDLISSTSFEYIPENEINKSLERENVNTTTPLNATKNVRHSESAEDKNDLQAGFKLLSTLIKADNLSNREKVVLVKKIVKKLASFEQLTQDSVSTIQSISIINDKATNESFHKVSSQSANCSVSSMKSSETVNTSSSDMSFKMTVRSLPRIPNVSTNKDFRSSHCPQKLKSRTRSIKSNVSRNTVDSKNREEHMHGHLFGQNKNNLRDKTSIGKAHNCAEQLELMKEWLEPLTVSELKHLSNTEESPTDLLPDTVPKIGAAYVFRKDNFMRFFEKEKRIHLDWIESEIDHLRNLQNLLEQTRKGKGNCCSEFTALYDKVESYDISIPQKNEKPEETCPEEKESSYSASNSKRRMNGANNFVPLKYETKNAFENIRSKLETPSSELEESIKSFVRNRKQKFLENYRKAHYKSCNNQMESGHYSEPRDAHVAQNSIQSRTNNVSSTPNILVSSDSMSIVCTTNCSTTASIQHYGTIIEKATQTNDSLKKSRPILRESLCCNCNNPFLCTCFKQTIRTYPGRINKASQAKPQAEAYVITFYKSKEGNETDPQGTGIQQVLLKNYPKFIERADQRREVLKSTRQRRQTRRMLKDTIIQNNSMKSIENKLSKLKPASNENIRLFAPNEVKMITTRRYLKLNEVVEKAEKEKTEKAKRYNKISVEMFNKKVQKQVRKGKPSFPLL